MTSASVGAGGAATAAAGGSLKPLRCAAVLAADRSMDLRARSRASSFGVFVAFGSGDVNDGAISASLRLRLGVGAMLSCSYD